MLRHASGERQEGQGSNGVLAYPAYTPVITDPSLLPLIPPTSGRESYYPYGSQQDTSQSWTSYPSQDSLPPTTSQPWYPSASGSAGPSAPPTYPPPSSHALAPFTSQFGRPAMSAPVDYPPVVSQPHSTNRPSISMDGVSPPEGGKEKSAAAKKRRRKLSDKEGSPDEADADKEKDKDKRIKTGRACDACVRGTPVFCNATAHEVRGLRRSVAIFWLPRTIWDKRHCAHTASNTGWNVPFSCR
jgi:hypothetical protein